MNDYNIARSVIDQLIGENFKKARTLLASNVSQIDVILSIGQTIETWEAFDDQDDDQFVGMEVILKIAEIEDETCQEAAFLVADSRKWWGLALRMLEDKCIFHEIVETSTRKEIFEVWTEMGFFNEYEASSVEEVLQLISLDIGEDASYDEFQIEKSTVYDGFCEILVEEILLA